MTTSSQRHLLDAIARLSDATARWPQAARNLLGTGPLGEGGAQGGYPSGHQAAARLPNPNDDERPDPCRQALRSIDHAIRRIVHHCDTMLGLPPQGSGPTAKTRKAAIEGDVGHPRLHATLVLIELCLRHPALLESDRTDDVRRQAGIIRQAIVDNAWTTTTSATPEHERCRDCWAVGVHVDAYRTGLCDWCDGWHRAYRCAAPRELLKLRHSGVRITSRHIDEALRPARKRGRRAS